ncbi:MAG: phosphodiester glycosidase family protein [Planctomycetaceae bacterium]|jgi:exopolysaccharide biosynthesis protein|nr:phosphodiester glycosidase family protein [Planctomycetaceae bacterium]
MTKPLKDYQSFDQIFCFFLLWCVILYITAVFAQESEFCPNPETPVWIPIFKGIEKTQSVSRQPRLQQVFAVRIDTKTNGISFFSTPKIEEKSKPENQETVRQQTDEFLKEYRLQVAINANFFSVPKGEKYSLPGTSNLQGLAVSEGSIISPSNEQPSATFAVLKTGQVQLKNYSVSDNDLYDIQTAVTGNTFILHNGKILPQTNNDVHPRTLCGLTQDNRYVIFVVIDGRRQDYSEGATYTESAQWLCYFGAWNGLNLDGGGSTTLVIRDETGKPVVQNRPSDKTLRYNGNNIGVRALPLSRPFKQTP